MVGEKMDNCVSRMVGDSKGNSKALFDMYGKLVNSTSSKESQSHLPDAEEHGGSKGLANKFNNFFAEKVHKTNEYIKAELQSLDLCTNNEFNQLLNSPDNNREGISELTSFRPCDMAELQEILSENPIKTTYGIDPLPKRLMSDCIDVLLPHLLDLINTSLVSGSIDGVKYSHVKPLLKKFDLECSEFSSYRPISNLSFISKLVERVVARRLNEHMTINNFHTDSQHGYKSNHSTETLLVKFLNDIIVAIDKKTGVVVLLIDLSAAFDTVQHSILLNILKSIHVKGIALNWFRSFLSGRTQCVIIDGILSDWIVVDCRVPQGSVLGPILFNIYSRYIDKVFKMCGFSSASYADDNSALRTFTLFNQFHTLHHDVPHCLQKLKRFMAFNHLKLNDAKTEIILFGSKTFKEQVAIHGTFLKSGECIRFTDSAKYLGVIFDSLLNFEEQIQRVSSVSYLHLRKISSIRNKISRSNLETLVHTFICSQIDYCNIIYVNLPKKLLKKLQKLQNAAIRIIFNVRSRHPVSSLFAQLHWLNVEQRVIFKCLLMVYKTINGVAPNVLNNMITIRNRRNCTLQDIYYNQTKLGKRAFIYFASRYWNILPQDIRCTTSIENFKTLLQSYLLTCFTEFKLLASGFR